MNLSRSQLEDLGYVETSPGTWAKPARHLAPVQAPVPEPPARVALDPQPQGRQSRPPRLAEGHRWDLPTVTLVVHRRRLLPDRDNLIGGCKHLRDAIADWLGLDDRDSNVNWEYAQVETKGPEGVAVSISKGQV